MVLLNSLITYFLSPSYYDSFIKWHFIQGSICYLANARMVEQTPIELCIMLNWWIMAHLLHKNHNKSKIKVKLENKIPLPQFSIVFSITPKWVQWLFKLPTKPEADSLFSICAVQARAISKAWLAPIDWTSTHSDTVQIQNVARNTNIFSPFRCK